MRLWHQTLIPILPRAQLLGQHRECAALRGAGWGRPHATVNYVFTHSPYKLYLYHALIMEEMEKRGYKPDVLWKDPLYRGKAVAHTIRTRLKHLFRRFMPNMMMLTWTNVWKI